MEVACRRETVAGVVAHSADHDRRLSNLARNLPARGFHHPVDPDAEALLRERVDLFDLAASD